MANLNINAPNLPTTDQKDAMDGANTPDSGNPFATVNDLTGGLPTGAIPSDYFSYDSDVSPAILTESATFVAVTGSDITITSTASVRFRFGASFSASKNGDGATKPSFRISRIVAGSPVEFSIGQQAQISNNNDTENGSVDWTSSALPAGTHTFRVEWRRVSGGGELSLLRLQFGGFALQAPKGDDGAAGANGTNGTNGQGVPIGGATGQVLAKISATDYDTEWTTPSAGGGSIDIGTTPMVNGTVGRIPFQGAGNVVQQDSELTWDNTLKRLSAKTFITAGATAFNACQFKINDVNTGIAISVGTLISMISNGAGVMAFNTSGATPYAIMRNDATFGWGNLDINGAHDTTMRRYSAGVIRVGNGTIGAGNLFIGGTTGYNSSAIFQTDSTTKGFLPPRMTSTQRTEITSPAIGLEVYQIDGTEGKYINKSTGWTFIG